MIHGGGRLTAANAIAAAKPVSPFALAFGANEMDGKILPCHRVKEDGLVRITHETVSRRFPAALIHEPVLIS
jgi:M-phase inducer tyrosine phosphatase